MEAGVKINKSDEDLQNSKPIMLFGRDIRKIPCFRKSFLVGICGGIVGGLACFMATSKGAFSTHVAVGTMWFCVFAYWFPCRHKHELMMMHSQQWKEALKNKSAVQKVSENS